MKKGLFTLIALIYSMYLFGTTCITMGMPLTSQADVDNIGMMNCDTIDYIIIDDSGSMNKVTDLSPLAGISVVINFIQIQGTTQLTSLNGLDDVQEAASLTIQGNTELVDINALSNFNTPGAIVITGNPKLSQCCALKDAIPNAIVLSIDKSNATGCTELAEINQDTSCDPAPIPTLGEWAMIQLILIFSIVGIVALQNKKNLLLTAA